MSNFVPTKHHLRELLIFFFHSKKSATDAHQSLCEVYGDDVLSASACKYWFRRFNGNDFDIKDKQRSGQPEAVTDAELEAILEEDPCQTQEQLAEIFGVTQQAISLRLKALGMVQKQGNWIPYELKPRDVERRLCMCEQMLQRQQRKGFLHRIVTGDEKWIYYDNPKRKKSWGKPGHVSESTPEPNIHGSKLLLCIWWDQLGVIYHDLLKPNETITGDRYKTQLISMSRALREKRPQYTERHDKVILLHDNARPHNAQVVKQYLKEQNWEILSHPPYSPDIAPSDFHLFRSMAHELNDQRFCNYDDCKKWIDSWIGARELDFWRRGIAILPERWAKVVASDGQYFE